MLLLAFVTTVVGLLILERSVPNLSDERSMHPRITRGRWQGRTLVLGKPFRPCKRRTGMRR